MYANNKKEEQRRNNKKAIRALKLCLLTFALAAVVSVELRLVELTIESLSALFLTVCAAFFLGYATRETEGD